MRHVGNQISTYEEGDLVMLGSNLPHGYTTTEKTKQIVIQFKEGFLDGNLIGMKDLIELRSLFDKARTGLEIKGKTKKKAIMIIKCLQKEKGLKRIIKFLKLLLLLSESEETLLICPKEYSAAINPIQFGRMKLVLEYIEANFQNTITISDAAKVINLTDSAFYKFIQRHTNKRFTEILNEYRIDYASKKLMATKMTVGEICQNCASKLH